MPHKNQKNLGSCQVARECPNKASYLIGSLKREMQRRPKFLYVCRQHEEAIAKENGKIAVQAADAGKTTIEYVSQFLSRGGRV